MIDRERRIRLKLVDGDTFLTDALMCGPMSADDVVALGRAVGLGRRTIDRAARRLRVLGRGGPMWSLPYAT